MMISEENSFNNLLALYMRKEKGPKYLSKEKRIIVAEELSDTLNFLLSNLYILWSNEGQFVDEAIKKGVDNIFIKGVDSIFVKTTKKPFGCVVNIPYFPHNVHVYMNKYGRLESKEIMLNSMVKDYEFRAKCEREAGGKIEINSGLPYVAITMSDGGEYFFQGEEASDLLDDVPDNINEEDFILAIAQGW
jgi:hypothetical protein